MTLQDQVLAVTLIGLALVTLAFIFVVMRAGEAGDTSRVQKTSNMLRRWWFWVLIFFGVGVAWGSLNPFPIPRQFVPSQAEQVVDVVGYQWYWTLSETRLTAGEPVEFRVSSGDVNHGFAIYDSENRLLTQTQAMPGYTNKLLYTFEQPGRYQILCLEYCGVAHHVMRAELEVVAANAGDGS